MARLVVSDEARADVTEIISYLRREAGDQVALAYTDSFARITDLLVEFPGIGTPRPELGTDARSVVVKPYVLIYDYDAAEDAVTLLRILHGRRNITANLLSQR